jgi:hypothetical protein
MSIQVSPAPRATAARGDGVEIDVYVAPSGARFEYTDARLVRVVGHPTAIDEVKFAQHMARRSWGRVRVLGISLGGSR